MIQLVGFLVIISVLVLVHEWGHYICAKIFGVRVEEFGFGLPPRAKALFIRKGTLFSLNWLPIGGFVRLYGEEYSTGDELVLGDKGKFYDKPARQRAVILVAGVMMNFLLGILLFAAVYSFVGIPTKTDRVRIAEMIKGSPAELAGLKGGEVVSEFMGTKIKATDQLVELVNEHKGEEVVLSVVGEDGTSREVKVVPRADPPEGEGALGVVLSNVELIKFPWWQMPFRGVVVGLSEAVAWGKDIAFGMWQMLYGILTGKGVPRDLAGPVGIYQVSGRVMKEGVLSTLQFVGVLSVNLAVLNILPFPALDGGRFVFLGVEKLIGKRRKNIIEGYLNTAGMIFLLSVMALITIRDVWRIVFH